MKFRIRKYMDSDIDAVIELSLLAWEPVFRSFKRILGQRIYAILYPDWREGQRDCIISVCTDREKYNILVAEYQKQIAGFLAYELKKEKETGEVLLLAVHPAYQNNGIGTRLNEKALAEMMASGAKIAVVEAGGDDSHAPSRKSYEKAGYTALPITHYFKAL